MKHTKKKNMSIRFIYEITVVCLSADSSSPSSVIWLPQALEEYGYKETLSPELNLLAIECLEQS